MSLPPGQVADLTFIVLSPICVAGQVFTMSMSKRSFLGRGRMYFGVSR